MLKQLQEQDDRWTRGGRRKPVVFSRMTRTQLIQAGQGMDPSSPHLATAVFCRFDNSTCGVAFFVLPRKCQCRNLTVHSSFE